MANWQLRGHRELTEPATVRPPSILEDVGPLPSAILAHLGRRLATKGAVDSAFVVIIAKRGRQRAKPPIERSTARAGMGVSRGVDLDGKGKCGRQPTRTEAGEGHGVRRNLTGLLSGRDNPSP